MLRERSEILPVHVDQIPQILKEAARWAIWKAEPKSDGHGGIKLDKVPYSSLQPFVKAKSTDPATWSEFDAAHNSYLNRDQTGADGLLFALGDGFAAVDIDDALNVDTGEPDAAASQVIADIDSYTERSVSGRGARIFAFGPEMKGIKFGNHELYSRQRFMTVTGHHIAGTSAGVEDRETQLEALRERLAQERLDAYRSRQGAHEGGVLFRAGDADPQADAVLLGISDDEIIDAAYDLDGFVELWHGGTSAYEGDASRADLALASRLAFLCGPGQQDRVRRLMEQSGLVREKWFLHRTYLMGLTIAKAYEGRTEYYPWAAQMGFGNRYEVMARRDGRVSQAAVTTDSTMPVALVTRATSAMGRRPTTAAHGDDRPTIVIGPETDAILKELECHMAPHLYQRNGRLVRVEQRGGELESGHLQRPKNVHLIADVSQEMTHRLLSRHVRFVTTRTAGRGKQRKTTTAQVAAPANLAKLFTHCGSWSAIPHLVGVTTTPFIRRDGTVIATPGFDPVSGYMFINDGTEWPPVPDNPTDEQVQDAVEQLYEAVCDFPFEKPEHRSAWLAGLLSTVGRPAIAGPVPMIWVDGNRKGTGKSKLPRLISAIACGHDPTEISYSSDEKELENRLAAVLLAGDRVAVFDNATGSLRNPVLDRFLTSTMFGVRRFHAQELMKLLNNTVLAVTGNNLVLRGDLSRRILRVRLVTSLERPDQRNDFTHPDLFGFVRNNRPRLLVAALTILRAHAVAGFPVPTVLSTKPDGTAIAEPVRPVGSFREWDIVVRHAMLRIGLPDPALTQNEAHEEDEGDIKLLAFFRAWHDYDPQLKGTVTGLIGHIMDYEIMQRLGHWAPTESKELIALKHALFELTETEIGRTPCSKTLGYRLRDARDKKIGGFRLEKNGKNRDGVTYSLVTDEAVVAPDSGSETLGAPPVISGTREADVPL